MATKLNYTKLKSKIEDRAKNELYPTDPLWVEALLRFVKLPKNVWECATSPNGPITQVLRKHGHKVFESDIATGTDFLTSKRRDDAIITNPPFSLWDQFALQGLKLSRSVLVLLGSHFHLTGGTTRFVEIFEPHPPTTIVQVVNKMKVFGKPSVFTHCWFVWDKRVSQGETSFYWTNSKELS